MYCTEISSWFVNTLRPGTIKPSEVSGLSVYQVADHMRALFPDALWQWPKPPYVQVPHAMGMLELAVMLRRR